MLSILGILAKINSAILKFGRLPFFGPILSGKRNISCRTGRSPEFGTSDGLALGIGEGRIAPVTLPGREISDLVGFLRTLTGTRSILGRTGKPKSVPSGLEVD